MAQRVVTGEVQGDVIAISRRAQRTFSLAILITGVRCVLTYVVLPFVTPLLEFAPGVGPTLGIGIGVLAIAANLYSLSRFWRLTHRWRILAIVVHVVVVGFLAGLMVGDAIQLMSG